MDDDSESVEEGPSTASSCARTRSIKEEPGDTEEAGNTNLIKEEHDDTAEVQNTNLIKEEHDDTAEEDQSSDVCMSCSHCKKTLVEGRTVYQRKHCPDLFCSAPCLSAANPAKRECHNCFKWIERPQDLILAPVDDKGTTKAFCSHTCLSAFNHKRTIINKVALRPEPSQSLCSLCNKHCISKYELTLDGVVHKMCSDDCFVRFRTAKNLTVFYCVNCDACCFKNIITLNLHDGNITLCSDECLTTFKQKIKTPSACNICKTYRQTSDMFDVKSDGNVALLCTKSCVMAYKIRLASMSDVPYPCDNCSKITLPAYHVALSDESIKNFCSLPCAMAFQTCSLKATNTSPPSSSTTTSSSCKIMKNKAILCKPMVQDVGVSCTTQVVNSEAQTDDNFPKVIILPVPFPVFVPVPMNLLSSKPIGLPVQEYTKKSRSTKMDNGPTTTSLSGNDQAFCGGPEEPEMDNSDESCGGDYLPDSAQYSDSERISESIAEEIPAQNKLVQKATEEFDDTADFSSDESFTGDYVPDSALYSDPETPVDKQKLPSLENTPTVPKSSDDLSMDNETMDSGNERDDMPSPAPRSTPPPQKRSRGRPPKRKDASNIKDDMPNPASRSPSPPQKRPRGRPPKSKNDDMPNPASRSPSPPQKRPRGRPPKRKNAEDPTASSSEESCSEEYMPDSEPEPGNDSDSSTSLSAVSKQRLPRLRKSTVNKRLRSLRKVRKVTEFVEEKMVTENEEHVYTTKNYCYFCGQAQSKISRHLEGVHKETEPDVAKAFSLRKNSKERKRLIDILRNKGNHKHNEEVLHTQIGKLKLKKKPQKNSKEGLGLENYRSEHFVTCPYCKAMFSRRSLWRHVGVCPSKTDEVLKGHRRLGRAVIAQSKLNGQYSPETLELLETMRQDEISVAVLNDVYILELAQDLCAKHGKTVPERTRDTLRALGRLVLTMKKKESSFSIEDAVKPNSVDRVIEAMKEVSGFNEQNQSYQRPTLALKLERGLMKISDLILHKAKAGDDEQAVEEVQTFQKVFSSRWAEHAPAPAARVTLPTQDNKPSTIPFTHDVQLLYKYLQKKAAEAIESLEKEDSPKTYSALAKVTLAQISFFSKLHPSETSKMSIKSFMRRVQARHHADTAGLLSEFEQKLCTHFSMVDIMGRSGRKVAAFLPPDVCSAVMLLVKKRIACNVYESNPFVFAKPKCHRSAYSGQNCIRICTSECGAQSPEFLRSRYYRKHIGTLFQILNLENNELYHLGTFFDCDIRADRDFYRLPEAALEIAKISRLVEAMEQGHLRKFQGKSLDELEIDDEINPDIATQNIADNSGDEGEDEESTPLQLEGKRKTMDLTQAEPTTSPQEEPSTSTANGAMESDWPSCRYSQRNSNSTGSTLATNNGQAKQMEELHTPQVALSTRLNKRPLTVPFTHDVQLLYRYLEKKAAEALEHLNREDSPQAYSDLAKVTLAQIIMFNKLHASEVSEMTIKDFMERTWAEVRDTDTAFVLSEFEQKLCTHFSRVDVTAGKLGGSRKVAVLLSPEVDSALMLLVNKRVTCGVPVTIDPLVFFPPKGHGYYNGQDCIKTFARECGAQGPVCLGSRYFRKHAGTLFHILNLKNYELCKLATLLGCYIQANRDFYQLPGGALELAKISKLVQEMEHGYLWKFQGKSLDDIQIDDEIEPDLAWDTANNGDDEAEDEESVQPVQPVQLKEKHTEKLDEVSSSRDGKQKLKLKQKQKMKWTEKEVNAVMKHFKVHISKGQLATVIESRECRDAEYATLKHRTVQNIRDFVRNRGIKKSK